MIQNKICIKSLYKVKILFLEFYKSFYLVIKVKNNTDSSTKSQFANFAKCHLTSIKISAGLPSLVWAKCFLRKQPGEINIKFIVVSNFRQIKFINILSLVHDEKNI